MNNNIKVNNIDGTPFPEAAGSLVSLVDAVEIISSTHVENLLGNREGKKNYKEAESVVHNFLSQARIQANLLTGDYQAGLKLVSPIFFDSEGKLSELPYLNILVALLAGLKKQTKTNFPIQHSDKIITQLDTIIDGFIEKSGTSPSDAIAILAQMPITKDTLKLVA